MGKGEIHMAILEKEVWVGLGGSAAIHYEKLGYEIPRTVDDQGRKRIKRGTKMLVQVKDLPISEVKLTKICDECGSYVPNQAYSAILRFRKNGDGRDRCNKCASKIGGETQKKNIKFENSLEYLARKNNKGYLLSEFSIENNKKPSEISYGTDEIFFWDCPICNNTYDMKVVYRTKKGCNCPYCAGKRTLKGYNDLWTTNPDIAKMLKNSEMGYEVTAGSSKKEYFKCNDCNTTLKRKIRDIVKQGFPCKCSDGIRYPEKFMMSVLDQLNIEYETQKTFDWSKNIMHENKKLSGDKRYDFYLENFCIVETHGGQHYRGSYETFGGKNMGEEQENDLIKENLAKSNGIPNYIVIDCRRSDLEFIKNNIISSDLSKIYDLNNIDWLKCHQYACSSLVREVCDLWNQGIQNTIEIGKILKLSRHSVIRFLKQGTELFWCQYDGKTEMIKSNKNNAKNIAKKVVQLSKSGNFIREYDSIAEAERETNIHQTSISHVVNKHPRYKTAGNFKWVFKDEYEQLLKTN